MARSKPEFFKIFQPNICSKQMRIPPAFNKYLGTESLGAVSLKGPSGNVWEVELVESSDRDLLFNSGWKEFVTDHRLNTGDFLVFRLDGCSCFSVAIFEQTACEKAAAFCAKPCQRNNLVVIDICDDDDDDAEEQGAIRESGDSISGAVSLGAVVGVGNKRKTKGLSCLRKVSFSENFRSKTMKADLKAAGVTRVPSLISKRRPISEEEKNATLERAKSFKSKKPFVLIVMKHSYVYVGFYMNIPCSFSRLHLPKATQKITLWGLDGKPWQVKYIVNGCSTAFSGGWSAFSFAHNLEQSDVCIFEVIRDNHLKVHIYRVVEEITPLTRYCNRKI